MNVHQFLTSFAYGDAIGNEAVEIRRFLQKKGFQSEIFSLFYHPRYAHEVKNYLEYDRFSSPENILIFHFSISSPVTKKFIRLPDRKFIIYHNITPYQYFLDTHRKLAKECYKGRIELKSLQNTVEFALGDSEYNRQELEAAGYKKTGVLPLLMNFTKFDQKPLPVLQEIFQDGKVNIIYVGRIITHKKIEDIIKIFYWYQKKFNSNSRLLIIGEYRGFERYMQSLLNLTTELQVKYVHFSGHIPQDELISYFKLSHLYLHMSEHEGFCAPIVESFYLNIPVIAYDAGAVKETMNGGGIILTEKQYLSIAALIHEIMQDPQLQKKLLSGQQKALERYDQEKTGQTLLRYLQ